MIFSHWLMTDDGFAINQPTVNIGVMMVHQSFRMVNHWSMMLSHGNGHQSPVVFVAQKLVKKGWIKPLAA